MEMKLEIFLVPYILLLCANIGYSIPQIHTFENHVNGYCDGTNCNGNQYCVEDLGCVDKKPLGESCNGVGQCWTSQSECLGDEESMTCKCVNNWVQAGDQCVQGCSTDLQCFNGNFCNVIINGCVPKVDLLQPCTNSAGDSQCKDENAVCTAETCQCKPDFLEKDGKCIPKCTTAEDSCKAIEYCELPSGLCKRKGYLGEPCVSTFDSCFPENSKCGTDSKCACEDDFTDYYGSCLPSCNTNDDCTSVPDQYCDLKEKICLFKANLHQGCEESSVGPCLVDHAECQSIDVGRPPTCECLPNYPESNGMCIAKCQTSADCNITDEFCNADEVCEQRHTIGQECSIEGASECSGEQVECKGIPPRCICNDKFYESAGKCIEKCTDNTQCPGEFCHQSTGRCSPKIGLNGFCEIADTDQCKTDEAICDGNSTLAYCKCNPLYVEESGTCALKCKSNSDCGDDLKFCDLMTGGCMHKIDLGGNCLATTGEGQCKVENAECLPDVCKCKEGYAEKDSTTCVLKCQSSTDCSSQSEYCDTVTGICWNKVGLDQNCKYEDQCSTTDAMCLGDSEENKKCTCKNDDYTSWFGTCLLKCTPTTGCSSTEYCQVDQGYCSKKKGLGQKCTDKNECLSPLADCEGASTKTCQCDKTSNAINGNCVSKCTKTTVCDTSLQFCDLLSGNCYAKSNFNEQCVETDQCMGTLISCTKNAGQQLSSCLCVDNAVRESVNCRCNEGFLENDAVIKCLKLAETLDEQCEEDKQCKNLGNSEGNMTSWDCINMKCDCEATSSIRTEGRCYLKKVVGNSCENDKDCTGGGIGGKVSCDASSNKCVCTSGTKVADGGKSCKAGASSLFQINISLLILSLVMFGKFGF